ncbi:MAG TPA: hypothetical protein VGG84_11390 [Gemmatimonadaceae bacterium]|jgi:hypothetical protein
MTHRGTPMLTIVVATLAIACSDMRRESQHTIPPVTAESLPSMLSSSAVAPFCSDTGETAAMRCGEGAVMRHGDTLVIALSGIGAVKRVNDTADGERYVRYQYAGRMGGGSGTPAYHILDVGHYESAGVELVNAASGDSVFIGGAPILSPDGSRFATTSENAESCEATNQLDIWRITGDKPAREFELPPFDCTRAHSWWPSEITWRGQDTITFLRNSLPADSTRRAHGESDTTRAVLVHRATGWSLDSTVPASPRAH